jgi:hypothetical protein
MGWMLWAVIGVYLAGFLGALTVSLGVGPGAPADAFLRAVGWPIWLAIVSLKRR